MHATMNQQTEICIDLCRVFTLPMTEHGVLVREVLLLLETEFTSSATKSCQTLWVVVAPLMARNRESRVRTL